MAVQLPPDYRAFCALYQDAYLRYTQVRIRDVQAGRRIVAGALGLLATQWPHALTTIRPTEVAWELLRSLIGRAGRATGGGPNSAGGCEVLYRALPAIQADAVILRHRLLLDARSSAELMGTEPFTVTCQLTLAYRSLPVTFADCLQAAPGSTSARNPAL
ncbi:hypothetical protein [Streptomyces sp. NPDC102360]|uniref:hypothetical protein n=1 Tax=Streptomyces sp. NPDC102360 TaxID=3366160 RepID=UPI0038159DF4